MNRSKMLNVAAMVAMAAGVSMQGNGPTEQQKQRARRTDDDIAERYRKRAEKLARRARREAGDGKGGGA